MKKYRIHLLLAFIVMASTAIPKNLNAQDIDIGLHMTTPDTLEVTLTPHVNFNGIVSNLQFTIRWDASSGANLGAPKQVFPEIGYIPMQKSGSEKDDSGNRYQVFFGSGSLPMTTFNTSFTSGTAVTLLKVPVINGCSNFAIVNDAWTGDVLNNGDYFISLGGSNGTGSILTSAVQTCEANKVDIGLFLLNPDTLEVRLRPNINFSGIVSNVQFTIRWASSSGANLGSVRQQFPVIAYAPMQKSGQQTDDNGYRYQSFFGAGSLPISNFGASWNSGDEVVLLKVPVQNGCSDFAIVNDVWTNGTNGDYYVSLGGIDSTGIIYTSAVQACPLSVPILPSEIQFEIKDNEVRVENSESIEISLVLYNLKGQLIKHLASGVFVQGKHFFSLEDNFAYGIYVISLQAKNDKGVWRDSRKIVVE